MNYDETWAELELRHRQRARAEDRIRAARATGLRNLPLHDTAQNQVCLEIVQIALDLLAWMPLLTLTGAARLWEPRRFGVAADRGPGVHGVAQHDLQMPQLLRDGCGIWLAMGAGSGSPASRARKPERYSRRRAAAGPVAAMALTSKPMPPLLRLGSVGRPKALWLG